MTQKTKALILVGIIFGITLIAGAYVFNQTRMQSLEQTQNTEQTQIKQDDNKAMFQTVTASTLKGEVISVTEDVIEIDSDGTKKSFNLTQNTAVLSVDASKIEKKTITDVKKGDTVSIMTNQKDNSILSIQIGKDAGSVF